MKQTAEFAIDNLEAFKIKMLNWVNRFSIFCLLDNHDYNFETPAFGLLLGAGCKRSLGADAGTAFTQLQQFCAAQKGWLFGHFGYDLKNETESLSSSHHDGIRFPDLFFFEPEIVLRVTNNTVIIESETDPALVFSDISDCLSSGSPDSFRGIEVKSRFTETDYLATVEKLKAHILRGDCYEINFCQEFYASDAVIDPLAIYQRLSQRSPNPFSAFYRLKDTYCLCASPERYCKRTGNRLISQPIKGTAGRDHTNAEADTQNKLQLAISEKEKSENTMVVDLVRNDLSRVCKKGSVKVTELHGIYSFPQVHQMISTIEGEVEPGTSWIDIIKATFPMGSMTGAPKKRVMELIETYERTKRGLFSGTIGYVSPSGDFDFNVVIRSLLYNAASNYLSYQAGSAITFNSDPSAEYSECLAKINAITGILSSGYRQ